MNNISKLNVSALKVLIVDDAYPIRMIVTKMLKNMGFTFIDEATDGALAYQMALEQHERGTPYNLIISDWNMPIVCGLSLLKKIRTNPDVAKTPFLMLTAESETDRLVEAAEYGVNHFSTKPFSYAMLVDAVGKALTKK